MLCNCGALAVPKWYPFCSKICYDFYHKGIKKREK